MPFTKENLMMLYSLSEEDVDRSLTAAKLPVDKQSYEDEEISTHFDVVRNYFNSGEASDYEAATQLFEQHQAKKVSEEQPKNKKATKGKKSEASDENSASGGDRLNILQLIAQASERCGAKIELLEAIEIMPTCGLLPNQEEFTLDERDRFLKACELVRNEKKSHAEVAATNSDRALIEEINGYLEIASFAQAEQIRTMLPHLAVEQLQEIKAMFWQMTAQRLRQQIESGELEAEIKKASSHVISSGNSFRLLAQYSSRDQKSLLGSSTNASTNE